MYYIYWMSGKHTHFWLQPFHFTKYSTRPWNKP